MATVPLSGTNIRLLSGVPFSNDYKNTRWFDTQLEQTNYFLSKTTTYTANDHNFQRIEGSHQIKVNKSIDNLWGTNYLMFQNTEYNSKWFYGFVTKLEYVTKVHTIVHFEIDVFQTWKFDMNFKPSFVVREHCKLWNTDGSPVINTIDEGLNYGAEYETVSVEKYTPYNELLYLVIVSKSALHNSVSSGMATVNNITVNMNGIPQPLCYYIVPFKRSGSNLTVKIDGTNIPIYSNPYEVLNAMFTNTVAVNNIVSIYVTEYMGKVPISYDGVNLDVDGFTFELATIDGGTQSDRYALYVKNIWDYDTITHSYGNKYNGFTTPKESKLLMYPYTVTVLDDFKGNRIEYKNEYIKNTDLLLRIKGSLGPANKVSYSIDDYNAGTGLDSADKNVMSLEHALVNNSPNDISILSDYLSAYLQGNKNQIENQKNAAVFQGTVGAFTGGMVGMAQSTFVTRRGMGMNPIGATAAVAQTISGVGNAVLDIQQLQAKQRDANNTPPQLVKMGGNTSFDYGNGYSGVYVIKKQLTSEYRKKLEDFFNMFGYKVNEVKVPNFHTRQNWNYVQTTNCTILGNMNNEDLTELKSVFDNGITLWHTDDVGNYALSNGVIA